MELKSCQAVEIDCPEIMEMTHEGRFVKGFVVIRSNQPLDIVAVYTTSNPRMGVTSIHTERVPVRMEGGCPDLVIDTIFRPEWDHDNHRSIIRAVVKNIGSATAAPTIARVIDPSTFQPPPSGAPYNAIDNTPQLDPGDSYILTFYLPYWVFNPDAHLEVTADYKNQLDECSEKNNVKTYKVPG